MVQVIQQAQRPPSKAQQWSQAFGSGIAALKEAHEANRMEALKKADYDRMNAFSQQVYGEDFQLPQNPDFQKLAYGGAIERSKPSKPAGGLTGQAVPREISESLRGIVSSNPDASSDELKLEFDRAGIPPIYSNSYVENRRRQEERESDLRSKRIDRSEKRAEKIIDKSESYSEQLPMLDAAVFAMEDAIKNGDLSFWSPDNLAEVTGVELFRTAKGAQFKSAAKNYFINDLKSSGARPNQFIEKQLVDALAKIGRSEEANLAVAESFKLSNDLKRKYAETVNSLDKLYDDLDTDRPKNFGRLVDETMKPYIDQRLKTYENMLRNLSELEKQKAKKQKTSNSKSMKSTSSTVQVRGPDGTIYETETDNLDKLPEGYIVI